MSQGGVIVFTCGIKLLLVVYMWTNTLAYDLSSFTSLKQHINVSIDTVNKIESCGSG